MFERRFSAASVSRIGNPSNLATVLGLASIASLELGIADGRSLLDMLLSWVENDATGS